MDRSSRSWPWIGAAITTAAAVALVLTVRKRHGGRLPPWLWWVITLTGVSLLLSWATHCVANAEGRTWQTDETLKAEYSFGSEDNSERPSHISLLLCEPNLIVYGLAPGPVRRFVGMEADISSFAHWELVTERLPADFSEYATLIEPSFATLTEEERKVALGRAFVLWQFPRHVLMVVLPKRESLGRNLWGCQYATEDQHVSYFNEDNRTGDTGVYGVHPLAKEWRYGSFSRLRSYGNLIKYLFTSHDRTDLQRDPYFLYERDEISELEAKVDDLPSERREFMRRKLGLNTPP